MFNDSSDGGSVVMKVSPTRRRRFDKNLFNTEEISEIIKTNHLSILRLSKCTF
jgi:hypothetical protein